MEKSDLELFDLRTNNLLYNNNDNNFIKNSIFIDNKAN